MYEQNKVIKIQLNKIQDRYQIIDRTFFIKNPPLFSNELNIVGDPAKELDSVAEYIKSKYQNNKVDIEFNCISDIERREIEKKLNGILIKR